MRQPKISIVIPVYNEEETLERCLNSILHQNYKNYEVIVVDNNSTDRTKKLIKEFQKRNKKYFSINRICRNPSKVYNPVRA